MSGLCYAGSGSVANDAIGQVAGPKCDAPFGIVETLPDGGRWELCWGYRSEEGINLYNIHYKPKNGRRIKVLADAWISQIHVRYDNNDYSFLDVTDYGLGDENMSHLGSRDCPNGSLINPSLINAEWDNKNMICKTVTQREYAFTGGNARKSGWYMEIFSVAQVGEYSYIPTWRFYGDGTIELLMGATGKLQVAETQTERTDNCEDNNSNTACKQPVNLKPFSWLLNDNDYFGVSHTHNYFWRLDFDVGGTAGNDVVEEIEYIPNKDGSKRRKVVRRLRREAGRSINPERMRSWRLRDSRVRNRDGNNMAWHFEPTLNGHQYTGSLREAFNRHDFYVTRYVECERFVAANEVEILDNDGNPTGENCFAQIVFPSKAPGSPVGLRRAFVNNESIVGEDIVVYLKLSFHHIPRNEDEPHMHAHWNSIRIVPRGVTTSNSLSR